eukprot:TRINITY_DN4149_c0_g1_i2.p1 TRINITY_DN4149_c0_g1~~TRINITY_DN4149_c0_g1_i2.p1  ORF type:complete len:516 (+),score=137.71 TRINITY_DN4149_c0_g1_i2:106-1548(+)
MCIRDRYMGNDLTQEKLDSCVSKPDEWRKLLFSLSFFHAVVQERRKFGPLGWNIRYEFNDSDLETSITMMKNMLEEHAEIPWDALRFMTGEINYGGRVTDEWDRRALMTILSRFCNETIVADGYKLTDNGKYRIPVENRIEAFRDYVLALPEYETPDIFGMNANANIAFELKESRNALETILSVQPRDSAGSGGKTPDEIVEELATTLQERLPAILKRENEKPKAEGEEFNLDSLEICLQQEVIKFNRLLRAMSSSLTNLKKAIKGEVVLSADLDRMYSSLMKNQVPQLWTKVAYPSLKSLASWFDDLIERCEFFRAWLEGGKPKSFWLSAFYFPQGFLTSVLQNYARKWKIPIDTLSFGFEFMGVVDPNELHSAPEDGCYVHGLFMEACRFDQRKGVLEDSFPGEMFTMSPVIMFIPTENYQSEPDDYQMPVYKTTARAGTLSTTGHSTNFIIAIDCPTDKRPDYWILNGAAFVCGLSN